jgi:translation initiation factor IF-2
MDVLGTRVGGTRRGIRRIESPRPRDGGGAPAAAAAEPRVVAVSLPITLKDLSAAIGVKATAIIGKLMQAGQMATMNDYLNEEAIKTITRDFGVEVTVKKEQDLEAELQALENYTSQPENLAPRAPVVTFLGHVDHGKTSLLDKIRKTNITQRESGGITQHLGAYRVDKGDIHVVFIDTPGHKAFTEMRARGANVTDVAVLVVAADDGPMPQTEEAISHANAASVPIVVALNKVDKPNANVGRCKDLLAKLGLIPVEWGGKTEFVEVSALTSLGIDNLLEVVSLESQILDLKADPKRPAIGTVLDAESTTGRGVIATVLIQDGTLHTGDYVLCGPGARPGPRPVAQRNPADHRGPALDPGATERSLGNARSWRPPLRHGRRQGRRGRSPRNRLRRVRESERAERQKVTLENLFAHLSQAEVKELRLVVKADVKGSLEVLKKSITDLSTDEVKVKILHSGVGGISQEDVVLADASAAIVVGFQVVADDRCTRAGRGAPRGHPHLPGDLRADR